MVGSWKHYKCLLLLGITVQTKKWELPFICGDYYGKWGCVFSNLKKEKELGASEDTVHMRTPNVPSVVDTPHVQFGCSLT